MTKPTIDLFIVTSNEMNPGYEKIWGVYTSVEQAKARIAAIEALYSDKKSDYYSEDADIGLCYRSLVLGEDGTDCEFNLR